jgi:WD40 repeat protein/tRNA A-37 threonylcarbamoyl transferase component Bud32
VTIIKKGANIMAQENHCPQCGAGMPADAPEGLCPKCLMKAVRYDDFGATLDDSGLIEGPGTKIGRYELLSLIGEGGMGLVYLAEQKEPVKRRVALKIIKPGMDSRQVIARFEAERQALALLDHPNIAHVFDAGTTGTGRPYFIMEYVKGMSITRYCDEHRLDVEQRLRLFREVCEGVHHAHQKGIIHRDIKPSNILVSIHGDRAVPKIIDFGISKAAASTLTEKTMFTFQGQLLGTPEYMSPEQVDLATQDIDTRSDIYSLGVVLYELLAGVLPFERESLHDIGFAELQRTIREQEPASPSIRLTNLGQQAIAIANSRMTQVVPLARRLHRELEWIPLKAMRKDRCRRYKSASDMADDIQSYLNGNPLLAGPETAMYRMQKFVHKHAGSVATAALVSVAVIFGLVVSIIFGCRAEQARQQEADARIQVEQALMRTEFAEKTAQEQRKIAEEQADKYRNMSYIHGVALADAKYRERNQSSARKLLQSCPDDLRHWEWHRLNYVTDEALMTLGPPQTGFSSVTVSPDGKRIAAAAMRSEDITIWDAESGNALLTFKGHKNKIAASVVFSPDGKQLVSGGFDNTIKVWDVSNGSEIMTLSGHTERVRYAAVSPDGKRIASCSFDKTVRLWDISTGKELNVLYGHEDLVTCVAFSPDGQQIASGSFDQTVRIWDAAAGEQLKSYKVQDHKIITVCFDPSGRRIALGCGDGTIKVLNVETGEELMLVKGRGWSQSLITKIAFSPDGKRLVSSSYDQTVRLWDVASGKEITTLVGHESQVMGVVFTPDGQRIVSAPIVGGIRVWDIGVEKEGTILAGHREIVRSVVYSKDGQRLVSASDDGTIKIWDVSMAREVRTLRGHEGRVWKVAISPDGKHIISGSSDKTIRIWDADSGQTVRIINAHDREVYSVAISPDGKSIISGSVKSVKVWDMLTGEELMAFPGHEDAVHYLAFSPNGRRIASADFKTIRIWDASSGKQVMTIDGHKWLISTILFTPDGDRIITGAYDGTIKVWDSATGDQLMTLLGHKENHIESLAISPDGKRIVSGSFASTKLWDAVTGAELMTISDEYGAMGLAFSPDGKTIAGGCGPKPGDITLWESESRQAEKGQFKAVNTTKK